MCIRDSLYNSPFDGAKVSLYAEFDSSLGGLRAQGASLEDARTDVVSCAAEATEHGISAAALTPHEYLIIQGARRRAGQPLLDTDTDAHPVETWFPTVDLPGSAGVVVARSVTSGLRFRGVELARGADNRGHRMTFTAR